MIAKRHRGIALIATAAVVAGCSSSPVRSTVEPAARPSGGYSTTPLPASIPKKSGGGYYLDDGPGDSPPPNLEWLPDAVPRVEKLASGANRPYNVFGVDYVPDLSGAPYKQRGVGSWYGRKFHGQRTSSGEIYDMYAMTAAHPTLPIPCYALVTNLSNGKSVIVRVNDRGPFLHNRVMDLSYAAALKVGYLSSGSGQIEVERLMPADIAAGRIPPTTTSILLASMDPRSPQTAAGPPSTPPASGSLPLAPVIRDPVLVASGTPLPSAAGLSLSPSPSPSSPGRSLADRGIPPDLLPDDAPVDVAAKATAAPARLPETATRAGFWLQLGAFRARTGADSFAAHVSRLIDPAVASRVQVAELNGLYRVRLGPYAGRDAADGAASELRTVLGPTIVVPDGS